MIARGSRTCEQVAEQAWLLVIAILLQIENAMKFFAYPMCPLQPVFVTKLSIHSPVLPGAGVGSRCLHVHCYHHPAVRAIMHGIRLTEMHAFDKEHNAAIGFYISGSAFHAFSSISQSCRVLVMSEALPFMVVNCC